MYIWVADAKKKNDSAAATVDVAVLIGIAAAH